MLIVGGFYMKGSPNIEWEWSPIAAAFNTTVKRLL